METADVSATLAAYASLPPTASSLQERAKFVAELDAKLYVTFHKMAVYDVRASEGWEEWIDDIRAPRGSRVITHPPGEGSPDEGVKRPRFKEVDYVRIITPGDKDNIVDREIRPSDKMRFARQWEAYVKGHDQDSALGTPLKVLTMTTPPQINLAQIEELAFCKIKTVEQLASCSDGMALHVMGFHELKRKAQNFLAVAKADAPKQEMLAELEKRDREIASQKVQLDAQKAQLDEMAKQLDQLTAPKDKKVA